MTVLCPLPLLHQIPNIRMLQFYMRSNLGMVSIGDLIISIWQYQSFRTEKSESCVLLLLFVLIDIYCLGFPGDAYSPLMTRAPAHQERVLSKSSLVNQWVYYDDLQEHEWPKQPYHKEIPSQLYTPCSLAAASLHSLGQEGAILKWGLLSCPFLPQGNVNSLVFAVDPTINYVVLLISLPCLVSLDWSSLSHCPTQKKLLRYTTQYPFLYVGYSVASYYIYCL